MRLLILLAFLAAGPVWAGGYELAGRLVPEVEASVALHGATTPYENATLTGAHGRFHFRKLAPGTYTLAVFEPERGEARQ
ncbi:MAG: carboxypeptidase-like regulatory domain-containing protein, partial [Bryobacteraceae bacterium]